MEKEEKKDDNLELDFPFYNDNPKINVKETIILALIPILMTIFVFLPSEFKPGKIGAYLFCIVPLLMFLYVAKCKISLLIKKPKVMDFVRVFVTLILQYIFALSIAVIIKVSTEAGLTDNPILELDMGFSFWAAIIFQLFGEELYKILIFLVTLILMYKITKKRKLSIAVAIIISALCFAFIHMDTYNNVLQVIVLQGIASIFCMYNYLKSKSILTSYLQHLLFDAIPFILVMVHVI